MVLKESVFIVNVLCSLVPCDIKYPYPDTSKDPDALKQHFKIEYNGPVQIAQQNNFYMGHPIVWTNIGKMEGYFMKVVGGRKIFAFEGIPYAEPPLGEHRFRPPLPKQPWNGLYQANEKGPDCIQYNMIRLNRLFGEENCLYLNVYTPYIPNQGLNVTNIPVLVWFHDGGFLQGSGSDVGPSYLLQNDVILVTINYRLGVLGFMSTGDSSSPGNYGLKDQLLALKWVNQNIVAFSGDPTRVTLIGHGSGGANVHLQMISPRARGLFSSAISLSGTAFNYWSLHSTEEARNLTHYFGKMINCPVHNGSQVLVHCLRQMDALELVQYQIPLLDDWFAPIILFRPTIEHDYQVDDAFLTETPEEAYNKRTVANVPYMASFTADEGLTYLLLHAVVGSMKMLRRNWKELAPDFLDFEQFNVDIHEITRRITWFYLKEVNSEKAPLSIFANMIRDRFILGGVHKALQAHCQIAPTYGYVFAYNGKYNLGTKVGYKPQEWGVGHGEDVYYIVNSTLKYNGFQRADPELILSKIMVNLISNFAHKGEPTFTTENGENIRIWNPITDPKDISILLIDKVIKMIPEPFMKNIHFWESLGLPDSQPLNFGSANPAIRNFGNGLLNNGISKHEAITQIQGPVLHKNPVINTQITTPFNNGLNTNYNHNVNEPILKNQASLRKHNDPVRNANPQYVGERAPDKDNINFYGYDNNGSVNSPGSENSLNQNTNADFNAANQREVNTENLKYPNPTEAKVEKNANLVPHAEVGKDDGVNYDYIDPNVPFSQEREIINKVEEINNNSIPANLFQNGGNDQNANILFGPLSSHNVEITGGENAINGEENNGKAFDINTPSSNINDKIPPPPATNNDYDGLDTSNGELNEGIRVEHNKEQSNNANLNANSTSDINGDFDDPTATVVPKSDVPQNIPLNPDTNINDDPNNYEVEYEKNENGNQDESGGSINTDVVVESSLTDGN